MKAHLTTDFYKVSHAMNMSDGKTPALHPRNITRMYETLTPRTNQYFKYDNKMVVFGYEFFVHNLIQKWNTDFFKKPWEELIPDFDIFEQMGSKEVHDSLLAKFKKLHELGYLPIEIRALPEGTLVPMRVPVLSIINTEDEFYWLPGYLETTLLSNTFVTTSVASVARQFRKIGQKFADISADNNAFLDFQFHDFSERGQHGDGASVLSGLGHLSSFKGSDAIPAVYAASQFWKETDKDQLFGASVVATEHSIMESLGGEYGTDLQGQIDAWESLLDRNPKGILSVVSDTYNYWDVIDNVLPKLKDKIKNRDGKLVIRPDSLSEERPVTLAGKPTIQKIESTNQQLVETLYALYETFGGTINSKGYKVLDSHIGLLHGEGITLDNIKPLLQAIVDAGFSTENIVFGVGAYVYSVRISRDDFGQALKASDCVIDGKETMIFKKPKSEAEAFKRSPKGAVSIHGKSGSYHMIEELTIDEVAKDKENQMHILYNPDTKLKITPLHVIHERLLKGLNL